MKHYYFRLRCILLCLCLLTGINAFAYYEIDGIYYALRNGTAVVNSKEDGSYNSYSGDVVIPENVTYRGETYTVETIGINAFKDCSGLTSVSIPKTVTYIGANAFENCAALTSVNIPDGVSYVFDHVFYGCSSLTSIAIPNSVKGISEYAFYQCTSLTSVSGGNNVTSIGECAFQFCRSLESFTIPEGVTHIYDNAFYDCKSLNSIAIPNTVRFLGKYAFCGSGTTSLTIGNSLETIIDYTFASCENLTSVVIGDNVTTIGTNAFSGCKSLASIDIPESVTTIGSYAFYNSGLTSVTIPNSVTIIDVYAFQNCKSLKSVIIGDGVTKIGDQAFYNCNELKSVVIGSSVTSIGSQAFDCSGRLSYSSLTDVYCYAENTPPETYGNAFYRKTTIDNTKYIPATLHVPEASIESYQSQTPWNTFEAIVQAPSRTARIDDICYSFSFFDQSAKVIRGESSYSGNVVIPETVVSEETAYTVTGIGKSAFSNCSYLSSVTIPATVIDFSKDAFQNTSARIRVKDKSLTLVGLWNAGIEDNVYDTDSGSKIEPFKLVAEATASSVRLNQFIDVIGAKKLSENLYIDGTETNSLTFLGLDPETEVGAKLAVAFQYGDKVLTFEKKETAKTATLELTTKQPKVINEGNVIVSAQSNLDDEEANVGFEWRRNDWTDDFDSKSGVAYLYEGTMEGYIRSLNSNYLWKFRPYYTSNAGNTYYGEWKGLDPSDYSYFEPTVHTYATISVTGNRAEVKGYAMRGTDRVTSQGFMYWKNTSSYSLRKKAPSIPSDAVTVEVSGNIMTTALEDLDYETTYCYVAFVRTEENETFFGEVQTFSTSFDPDGIEGVKADTEVTEVARYDLQGRRLSQPQNGLNIIRYSDGSSRKVWIK